MIGRIKPQSEIITGVINPVESIIGVLNPKGVIKGTVCISKQIVMPDGQEVYEGQYDITPKVTEQIMQTANKYMIDDVTIRKIPVYKVSNTSGGTTVYIGTEDI